MIVLDACLAQRRAAFLAAAGDRQFAVIPSPAAGTDLHGRTGCRQAEALTIHILLQLEFGNPEHPADPNGRQFPVFHQFVDELVVHAEDLGDLLQRIEFDVHGMSSRVSLIPIYIVFFMIAIGKNKKS